MPDRRLVVAEFDTGDAHYGEMFALSPNRATGVNIPAFKTGAVLPTVGSTVGEAFYESNTSKGWVWDGARWKEIAASPIQSFRTEAELLADTTTAVGRMAIAADTGGLFIKQPAGWQYVGIKDYATAANLLADNPTSGSMGVALDENTLWQMSATGWRCLVPREFPDTASVQGWVIPLGTAAGQNPTGVHVGDQAVAVDVGVLYVRLATGWLPTTLYEDTEANIRAATWALNGQEAISTDTGRTFTYNSTVGWIEEPIQHYATEALLLAATPPNGTFSWADDTQVAFTRAGGTWHRLAGPQITIGATAPTTPGAGDMYMNSTTNVLQISDGTAWHVPQSAGGVVGDLRQSLLTEAQFATAAGADAANWVLADGRSVAGTAYATIMGSANVPDLRGAFLRMAGTNASNGAWIGGPLNGYQEDSTARPKVAFTTDSQGNHHHSNGASGPEIKSDGAPNWHSGYDRGDTGTAGAHTHTITGGGDTETRPKSYSVNYFIKVN